MEQLDILGIKVTSATRSQIQDRMDAIISSGRQGIILSANAHAVNLARTRPWLRRFFKQADMVHVDGGGIILAARLLGHRIPERITWADWAWELAASMAARKQSLFLLGGPPGLAHEAAQGLRQAVPGLRIAGTHHGYFNKEDQENDTLVRMINQARPDVIWIGMGMPLQEAWLLKNYPRLNARLFMICGGAFGFMAAKRTRCPLWMQRYSLEWLWLLIEDPRRGLVRYLWGNPLFLVYTLRCVLARGVCR